MKIDLHMHSHYSDDGEFTPSLLAEKCADAGIRYMAIADHNCAKAVKEGKEAALSAGLVCVPAIEIDCMWRGRNLHLLAYGIDEEDPFYAKIETDVDEQSIAFSKELFSRISRMGFVIRREWMEKLASGYYRPWVWTPEMFGEVLLGSEENRDDPRLMPFREGGSRSDNPYVNFYWDFCSEGKDGYVPMVFPDMEDILAALHERKALGVLAHPGANFRGNEQLIDQFLQEMDVDGVEVMSSYHTQEQTDYFYRTVRLSGKQITCGSDYHGKTKPSIIPGGVKVPAGMEEEQLEEEIEGFLQKVL